MRRTVYSVPVGEGYVYASTNGGLGLSATWEGFPNPFPNCEAPPVYSGEVQADGVVEVGGELLEVIRLPDGRRAYDAC